MIFRLFTFCKALGTLGRAERQLSHFALNMLKNSLPRKQNLHLLLRSCSRTQSSVYHIHWHNCANLQPLLLQDYFGFQIDRFYHTSQQPVDPDREQRRQKLLLATFISCFIGAILLTAIGLQHYKKLSMSAIGAEELKLREYGRRPTMYRYRGYNLLQMITNDIKGVHQFDVREDDIWVVSFPKSGTTWLQEIIYLLCNDVDFEMAARHNMDERFPYFEYPYPGKDAIRALPSPRLIKTHLPLSLLPNQMKDKNPKIIYIARNPKDVVVSFYNFAIKFFEPMSKFQGSFEDYCRLFIEDNVMYGPWWKHVLDAWSRKDQENVLVLFYEDLQNDLGQAVCQISAFLDKPVTEGQLQAIVDHCSFEKMQNNQTVTYNWLRDSGIATKNQDVKFLRKGKVGDWRNHLSDEMVKRFDEMVLEKMESAGVPIRDTLPESKH